jgi:two-component system, cell cycle response regulator DivK
MNKILIAEDNPVNLELLREILEAGHYQVVEAGDGREALAKIEETQPDLVLLDINMPVLDGFGAIREIRAHPRYSRLPVVAVTAYAMKDDRERILAAGFNGYVSKPIDAAALLRELQRLKELSNGTQSVDCR